MRCCCCFEIVVGATILGVFGIVLSVLELVPLVPYLIGGLDFDPLAKNFDRLVFTIEKMLKEANYEDYEEVIKAIRMYAWSTALGEAVSAGLYALVSLLMVIGLQTRKRGLALPYLVVQMLAIIVFILVGIIGTVIFFFLNIITGVVLVVVVMVVSFFLIYFWGVVLRAYKYLGSSDYTLTSDHDGYPRSPKKFYPEESMPLNK